MTEQESAVRGASQGEATVAVLLCHDLEATGNGLDVDGVCRWLRETQEGVRARVAAGLCHTPRELARATASGAGRVVLGVCSRDYAEREMQFQARKVGLDPPGVEVVNLGAFCAPVWERSRATEKAKLMLAAAIARARAYSGSGAENLKPYFPPLSQRVSRRALFTLPPVQYRVVASVDRQRCVADTGCALCVGICPQGALERGGGKVWVDKARCDGCGLCVTECPRQAVRLPGSSLHQLDAQITALLETNGVVLPERRILFVCRQSVQAVEQAGGDGVGASASWLPLEVPCAGMVPVGLLLQCLARGAAVGILSCGKECQHAQGDVVRGRVDYCRQLLHLFGASPERVEVIDTRDGHLSEGDVPTSTPQSAGPPPPVRRGARVPVGDPGAAAQAVRELAEQYGAAPGLFFEHPHSPVGRVMVAPEWCTGCGVCATACPTKALDSVRDGEEVALTFDSCRCISCGQCVSVCPEAGNGAIRLARVTDMASLRGGRAALHQDREKRCIACGAPIATAAMLARIAQVLGSDYAGMSASLEQYCPACR
ncbi:MAG: 4Fe-4S binding protein [Chloroflexi bacterium]|nr:4Fe-4S binding protein [Chloroflexota bacterium]